MTQKTYPHKTYIQNALAQANFNQSELAERLGVSRQAVSGMLAKPVKPETLFGILRAIGIPAEEIAAIPVGELYEV